jgi:hypothetical protein
MNISKLLGDLKREVNLGNMRQTKTGNREPFFNVQTNRRLIIIPQDSPDLNDD